MTTGPLIFALWFFCSALIILAWADGASAINRDQLPAMHQVAVDYFGPVTCGEVAYEFVPAATLQGPDAPLGALARGGGCLTQLSAEYFDAASWGDACEVVVHEYGHSVPLPHSPDRNSIMYPDDTMWPFAPCVQADPTHDLEQRCWRAEELRWERSDRTLDARRALRRLAKHAKPRRISRARRQVQQRRYLYEVARSEHRACLGELRAYGVGV